jgi:hypothetical protein
MSTGRKITKIYHLAKGFCIVVDRILTIAENRVFMCKGGVWAEWEEGGQKIVGAIHTVRYILLQISLKSRTAFTFTISWQEMMYTPYEDIHQTPDNKPINHNTKKHNTPCSV